MENTTGPIKVFFVGTLPKETYTNVNELARDIANSLAVDADSISVPLIPLEDLRGEQGEEGPRGLQGPAGPIGPIGPDGSTAIIPFLVVNPTGLIFTWDVTGSRGHHNATILLTGVNSLTINGAANGMSGTLIVHQPTPALTPAGTLSLPVNSRFPGGTHPVITTTADTIDVLEWKFNGTDFYWTFNQNFLP